MRRRYRLKKRMKRLNSNKSRRILQIYRLKRRISARHRVGFVVIREGK